MNARRRMPIDERVAQIWEPMAAKMRETGTDEATIATTYSVFLVGLTAGADIIADHPVALGSPSVGRLTLALAGFVMTETRKVADAHPIAAAH